MASLLHRLTKNRASLNIGTALKAHILPRPVPSLLSQQTLPNTLKPELTENQISLLGTTSSEGEKDEEASRCLHIFPNFPFGYCLNPVSATWVENLGVRETEKVATDEDARTVWADSVKKKRKRKMNKHKYKKLRKRLRRKARA
nr:uncharacterized protein LOC107418231 [Ziziphus jujuba var. spinosa]